MRTSKRGLALPGLQVRGLSPAEWQASSASITAAFGKDNDMNARRLFAAVAAVCVLASITTPSRADDRPGKIGRVSFATSCDPAVQPLFETGVAMLHSFWYSATEKAFREVLAQDPSCAIANWGIAAILMSNPLAGQGASPKGAAAAQAAIEQGRATGAKTQRERDYIEAIAAYYEDWSNCAERARQQARAKAFEDLATRYPNDDEAHIFSALYIAGTQSQSDQSFAAYRKASALLDAFEMPRTHPAQAIP